MNIYQYPEQLIAKLVEQGSSIEDAREVSRHIPYGSCNVQISLETQAKRHAKLAGAIRKAAQAMDAAFDKLVEEANQLHCRCGDRIGKCIAEDACTLFTCCGGYVKEGHMSDCDGASGYIINRYGMDGE